LANIREHVEVQRTLQRAGARKAIPILVRLVAAIGGGYAVSAGLAALAARVLPATTAIPGVVYVRFTMSRDGRVLAARIERATGVVSLDQEGLDLLQRAQPLPPLPSDQPGESLELLVPVQFYLKR